MKTWKQKYKVAQWKIKQLEEENWKFKQNEALMEDRLCTYLRGEECDDLTKNMWLRRLEYKYGISKTYSRPFMILLGYEIRERLDKELS